MPSAVIKRTTYVSSQPNSPAPCKSAASTTMALPRNMAHEKTRHGLDWNRSILTKTMTPQTSVDITAKIKSRVDIEGPRTAAAVARVHREVTDAAASPAVSQAPSS